jgi:hypothetical protein
MQPTMRDRTTFATGARQREVTCHDRSNDRGFRSQLAGFSLTTAEILYRLPIILPAAELHLAYDEHPASPACAPSSTSGRTTSTASSFACGWRTRSSSLPPSCAWSATSSACTDCALTLPRLRAKRLPESR